MTINVVVDAAMLAQYLSNLPFSIKLPGHLSGRILVKPDVLCYYVGDIQFVIPISNPFIGNTKNLKPFLVEGFVLHKILSTYKGKAGFQFTDLSESGIGTIHITEDEGGKSKKSGVVNLPYFDASSIEVDSFYGFKLEEDQFTSEFYVPVDQINLFDPNNSRISLFSLEDMHYFAYTTSEGRFVGSKGYKLNIPLNGIYLPHAVLKTIAASKDKVYYAANEEAVGFSFNGTMYVVLPLNRSFQDQERFMDIRSLLINKTALDISMITPVIDRLTGSFALNKELGTLSLEDMDDQFYISFGVKPHGKAGRYFSTEGAHDIPTWDLNIPVAIIRKIFPHYTKCIVECRDTENFFVFIRQDGSFIQTYSG